MLTVLQLYRRVWWPTLFRCDGSLIDEVLASKPDFSVLIDLRIRQSTQRTYCGYRFLPAIFSAGFLVIINHHQYQQQHHMQPFYRLQYQQRTERQYLRPPTCLIIITDAYSQPNLDGSDHTLYFIMFSLTTIISLLASCHLS